MKVLGFLPLFYRHADRLAILVTLLIALGLTLGITLAAWRYATKAVELEAHRHFGFRVAQMHEAIRGRMLDYAQLLRGGTGLFAASKAVSRDQWRAYVSKLYLDESYPGLQGLGYTEVIPGDDAPLVFDEVLYGAIRTSPGRGLVFDAAARSTLERARDSGAIALTPRLSSAQDTTLAADFLMFLPVYQKGMAVNDVSQRRLAVKGYVFAVFRANKLMRGILGVVNDMHLQIFDGADASRTRVFDDNPPETGQIGQTSGFVYSAESRIPVVDRVWTLRASTLPAFEAAIDRSRANLTLTVGLLVSLMLMAFVGALLTQRTRAIRITRRVTTELRESREVLGLALDGSNLALFDCNLQTGTVHLSERWSVFLGHPAQATDTTLRALAALVHPDDLTHLKRALIDVLHGNAVFYDVEHRVRHREGYWVWVRSRARVVERGNDGQALRLTGTNSDITERKQIQRMKDEFIATVNHELRTPLTALVGALALLKEESGPLPPTADTFLEMANRNADRLVALVNDILEIEKIEAGMVELNLTQVALTPFLEEAVALNQGYAEQHSTRYQLALPLPDIDIKADRGRLLQVVTNLLSNAAKYSPPGEVVSLSAEHLGDRVKISVVDRGPGIPEEFKSRIFRKFAQADTPDSAKKGGTGLGLAISKALIEAMNGEIGYTSPAGAGATFYVLLPVA